MKVEATPAKLVVQRFWETMQTNDFRAVGELLHDDYELEWPQSGERLRGRDNFAAVNENYPAAGSWSFDVQRVVCESDQVATDVIVTDGVTSGRALTFSTVRDGRILHQTEFWPDPFEPADWRSRWVERFGSSSVP